MRPCVSLTVPGPSSFTSLFALLLLAAGGTRLGSAQVPPSAGAFARFAKVKQWEGSVRLIYDYQAPKGIHTVHATTDWTVILKEVDPLNSPLDFSGEWVGIGSGVEHMESGSRHRDSITTRASGRETVSGGFTVDEDGYEFGGFGWVQIPGTQELSCSEGTCKPNEDAIVHVSDTDEWIIRRPFPAQGMVLAGSAVLTHDSNPKEVTPGSKYTVTWEFRPAGTRQRLEITKLEQEGGAKTADPKQVVFQNGSLRIRAEAKVTPESDAASLRWEAPAIGAAKPVIQSTVGQGGVVSAVIVYQGLPEQNIAFGNKTLKASVQERSAERPFQVFFDRDGTDNPQGRGSASKPNWYVYWKQGPVPELDKFEYSSKTSMAAGYDPVRKTLTITSEGPGQIPAIDAQLITKDKAHTYHLQRKECEGIRAVAAIVRHELRHKELHEMKGDDYDLDAVLDSLETSSGSPWLDPFQANTYDNFNVNLFYPDLNEWLGEGNAAQQAKRRQQVDDHRGQLRVKGDNELLAIIAEASRKADASQDWAFPGSQAQTK